MTGPGKRQLNDQTSKLVEESLEQVCIECQCVEEVEPLPALRQSARFCLGKLRRLCRIRFHPLHTLMKPIEDLHLAACTYLSQLMLPVKNLPDAAEGGSSKGGRK